MTKFVYIRSKKLLAAVRELPCQHCGMQGMTQAAHSNWSEHGKGMGIKASDEYVAALCMRCHYQLDQGKDWDAQKRRQVWRAAWLSTVYWLVQLGTWPADVPVPEMKGKK